MARVSIYVPDAMKARMDVCGDVNWSGIAQTAFELDLAGRIKIGDNTMQAIVDRIKASKVAYEKAEEARGTKEGREWASEEADYVDLRKMATIDISGTVDSNAEVVNSVFGVEYRDEDSWFYDTETREYESDEYVAAFLKAVSEVWDVVQPQL